MGIAISDEELPFAEFSLAVRKALAEWELEQLEAIAEAGKKDWRASAWLLERRFPDEYGPPARFRHQRALRVEVAGRLVP